MDIIDFTRRNDPATPAALDLLEKQLSRGLPDVLVFWSKNPNGIQKLYVKPITKMVKAGTLVLCQFTVNGYSKEMEPAVDRSFHLFDKLASFLTPRAIRLRFDPIIVGYTTESHFDYCLSVAVKYGISRITTNFLVPSYKGVGRLLISRGFKIELSPSNDQKTAWLSYMQSKARKYGIEIAVCAETSHLTSVPGIKSASCTDPDWILQWRPHLQNLIKVRGSRRGCGCCYTGDWGKYKSQDGYTCPHQCLYCYAK